MHSNYKLRLATMVALATVGAGALAQTATTVVEPGVQREPITNRLDTRSGGTVDQITAGQRRFFDAGRDDFMEVEDVGDGVGPRMNLDSCAGCHSFPTIGGTSPPVNPQIAFATSNGKTNRIYSFLSRTGPIREARVTRNPDGSLDGGVHALFTITGDADAGGCNIQQEDLDAQLRNGNLSFRMPTALYGLGRIETVRDQFLINNLAANAAVKTSLGISGRFNRNGNDGTISRFGWKAQNQSLIIFSGEAYNVEMGITNETFQIEREQNAACQFATTPNDTTVTDEPDPAVAAGGEIKFRQFMAFLGSPVPSTTQPGGATSISNGRNLFNSIGCDECHTPTLRTPTTSVAAFSNKDVSAFSDFALHNMGPGLADGVQQGLARGDEFRTAYLWGASQRVFFMHDGRNNTIDGAIRSHSSAANAQFPASEANMVVSRYLALPVASRQDIVNFVRSL